MIVLSVQVGLTMSPSDVIRCKMCGHLYPRQVLLLDADDVQTCPRCGAPEEIMYDLPMELPDVWTDDPLDFGFCPRCDRKMDALGCRRCEDFE